MRTLTPRQQQVLDFYVKFIRENSFSPSIRDVMSAFGFASTEAVFSHIRPLIRKGKLRRIGANKSRSIVPVVNGACPLCGAAHAEAS